MITVYFSELDNCSLHFCVKGHSSVNKGYDIVCSAVSALTQTFLRGLEKNLKAKIFGNFDSGNCNLKINYQKEDSDKFKIICEIFKDGFHEISNSYPEQVKLISQEIYHGS